MKQLNSISIMLIVLMLSLSSCEVVGGIFKAGVWVGVLAIIGIVALIIFFVSRSNKK